VRDRKCCAAAGFAAGLDACDNAGRAAGAIDGAAG
jgi:hypothetical protein